MSTYILILVLAHGVTTAEFADEFSCMEAIHAVQKFIGANDAICVAKLAPKLPYGEGR